MPRILLCVLIIVACASVSPGADLELARDGKTDYVIVVHAENSPMEKHAARELQHYLQLVTGAEFPVIESPDPRNSPRPRILVGNLQIPPLEEEGVDIRVVGRDIGILGEHPRGPINAVYTFLEEKVGVRWWTPTEEFIPHKPTLTIDDRAIQYTPKFRYREIFNKDAMADPAFAARLKLNGHHHGRSAQLGGHYTLIGWCHTSFDLVPPSKYFADHPQWYAQIDGKRQASTQLCLSNPDMRRELIANALKRVRKNPEAGIIDISQNDGFGPCQCDACQAIAKEEGSESGLWIRLANEAAAEINKEYPYFLVETLAYVYSRHPPKVTRPSNNVLVRLCSIECDFTKPLSHESNKSFGDDLRDWSRIAPNLFIWNYVTNFSNYLIPHPNMLPFADDLRFFDANHVVGVFQQGDAFNRAGDFLALRTWVQAHLLWNPSLDGLALRAEFLEGYYGAAAPHLARYLDLMDAHAKNPKERLGCYNASPDFLTDRDIEHAMRFFDDAEKAVAPDPQLLQRVRLERITLDHVKLLRCAFETTPREKYLSDAREWSQRAKAAGVAYLSEGCGFDAYVPILLGRYDRFVPPPLPRAGVEVPRGQFDIQEDCFALTPPAMIVDDPKASNNRAARTPGGSANWSLQFPIPKEIAGAGPWNCRLVIRADANKKRGKAFEFGLHDTQNNSYIAIDRPGLPFAGDGEYHAYTICVDELKPTMYFWVAAPTGKHVDAVYLDRILISRQP